MLNTWNFKLLHRERTRGKPYLEKFQLLIFFTVQSQSLSWVTQTAFSVLKSSAVYNISSLVWARVPSTHGGRKGGVLSWTITSRWIKLPVEEHFRVSCIYFQVLNRVVIFFKFPILSVYLFVSLCLANTKASIIEVDNNQ